MDASGPVQGEVDDADQQAADPGGGGTGDKPQNDGHGVLPGLANAFETRAMAS